MRPCFTFKAAANGPAILSIDDEIGFWGTQAKDFRNTLNAVSAKELVVEINSPGGDVFAGTAIYNMLRAWAKDGKTVVTKVSGVAASIASVIFLAGDKRQMPANTFAMIHAPWSVAMGNAEELREQADTLEKIGGSMLKTYAERTGLSEDEIKVMFEKDTWLAADEALEKGFATEVIEEVQATAKFNMERAELPEHVAAVFKAAKAEPEAGANEQQTEASADAAPAAAAEESEPFAAAVQTLAAKAGLESHAALLAVNFTTLSDVQARISECREIKALCAVAKRDEKADGFIRAGKTLSDVRAAIVAELAAEDEKNHTSGAQSNTQVTDTSAKSKVNSASLWASHNGQTMKGKSK